MKAWHQTSCLGGAIVMNNVKSRSVLYYDLMSLSASDGAMIADLVAGQ
jgi:hypothetical protein